MRRTSYGWFAEAHPHRSPWLKARHRWKHHARVLMHIPIRPWSAAWFADIMCIHGGEGAWNAIDPSGTYYGGLQMDGSFMATYGPEYVSAYGTADHWPPIDQIIAAWRAYQSRGFSPWPNTAAACGL